MTTEGLDFARPESLAATRPPELRGLERDEVRLLVTDRSGSRPAHFRDLTTLLAPGDLLVVNRSATLPAALAASGPPGRFLVHLSTHYGRGLWLAEPRWGADRPGPLPLSPGDRIHLGGTRADVLAPYPEIPRLTFLRAHGDLFETMRRCGTPIRYGYASGAFPLGQYQTVFGTVPGSSEMASGGRPFSARLLRVLHRRGVRWAEVELHTGVSSLELDGDPERAASFPEPFEVPASTVEAIERTRAQGGRVIAVGTTVVRALEAARSGGPLRPARGFTRCLVRPGRPPHELDGLISGFHDPRTSHLLLLMGLGGADRVREAYRVAVARRFLWHEFGDSHLLWAGS